MNLNEQQRSLIAFTAIFAAFFVDDAADEGFDKWFLLRIGWVAFCSVVLFMVLAGRRKDKGHNDGSACGGGLRNGTISAAKLEKGESETASKRSRLPWFFSYPAVIFLIIWILLTTLLVLKGIREGFGASLLTKICVWTLSITISAFLLRGR